MDFPKSVPSVGLVDGKFIDEDAVAGTPGSLVPSAWGNAVTLEILKVIQDAGLEPDEDDNTQLSAAIDHKISESSVAFATQPEAEAGESQTKVMSPLRVFQAIAKVVTQATESAFGWLKIATLSQTNTGTDDATAVTPKKLAAAVQTQTLNAGTTGGTAAAYTVSNIPGLSSYVAKLRLNVTFHAGGGVNPTINANALGPKNLKQYDVSGTKVPPVIIAGMVSDIVYDGTDWVLLNQLPISPASLQTISATVAANALTLGFSPQPLNFRNPTLTSGVPVLATPGAPLSMVVPSGATLGSVSGQQAQLALLVAYNGGSPVLCVANIAGGLDLSETGLISPTTISAGATSSAVIYSASAVSANSPYRVVGYIQITEATAGTWATAPSLVQQSGGQALASLQSIGYGQTWQAVTRVSGTTYYNLTGRPIMIWAFQPASANVQFTIGGLTMLIYSTAASDSSSHTLIVPPGMSYSYVGTTSYFAELR